MLRQILALFAAILIGLFAFAWVEGYSSSFQHCVSDSSAKTTSQNSQNQKTPLAVVVHSYVRCTERFANEHNALITALGTVLLAAITFGLILSGFDQQSTTRATLRAYVLARDGVIYNFGTPNIIEGQVRVRNYGKTPAHNVVMWIGLTLDDFPIPKALDHPPPELRRSRSIIGPRDQTIMAASMSRAITAVEYQKIRCKAATVYIFGHIAYDDIFGRQWETDFRFMYGGVGGTHPEGKVATCEDGNRYK
jgi:hypothetical protein